MEAASSTPPPAQAQTKQEISNASILRNPSKVIVLRVSFITLIFCPFFVTTTLDLSLTGRFFLSSMRTYLFNDHFPGKNGLAVCSVDFQSSLILILNIQHIVITPQCQRKKVSFICADFASHA